MPKIIIKVRDVVNTMLTFYDICASGDDYSVIATQGYETSMTKRTKFVLKCEAL